MRNTSQTDDLLAAMRGLLLDELSRIVRGRPVALINQHAARGTMDEFFLDAGAERVSHIHALDDAESLTDYYREFDELLQNPTTDLLRELDKIDPDCQAVIYAGSPVSCPQLAGRPLIGNRQPVWKEAETKRAQIDLLQQHEYSPTYYSCSAPDFSDSITTYCVKHAPCVLSGDATYGVSMAANHVFVVDAMTSRSKIDGLCGWYQRHCSGVRAAPFVFGMPTTVYGVTDSKSAVLLGPVEALAGLSTEDHRVFVPGVFVPVSRQGEFTDRDTEFVHLVISRLVEATGYRGAFGVDGVRTGHGFTAHEVNTRVCGGFSLLSHILGGRLPFGILDIVLRDRWSTNTAAILLLLEQLNRSVKDAVDVRLWGNPTLESELRRLAPTATSTGSAEKWRHTVRSQALRGTLPFYCLGPSSLRSR